MVFEENAVLVEGEENIESRKLLNVLDRDNVCSEMHNAKRSQSVTGNIEKTSTSGNSENASTSGNIEKTSTSGNSENTSTSGNSENTSVSGNSENTSRPGHRMNTTRPGNSENASTPGNRKNASRPADDSAFVRGACSMYTPIFYSDINGVTFLQDPGLDEGPLCKKDICYVKISSIITLIMFFPIGIPALYYALRAERDFHENMDVNQARMVKKLVSKSSSLNFYGIITAILLYVIIGVVVGNEKK